MREVSFNCGIEAVLDLLGGKWKLLIVYHLMHKNRLRFGELRRLVGNVSEKVLSQQLREMSVDGLVNRVDFGTVPPRVEYELTPFGRGFGLNLQPMCEWGEQNMDEITAIASARAVRNT